MTTEHSPDPEVLEAEWSRDKIDVLFGDLAHHAEIRHVHVRLRKAESGGAEHTVELSEAHRLFQQDAAAAIQVFYLFDGDAYCDTIIPIVPQVRIIRARISKDRLPD